MKCSTLIGSRAYSMLGLAFGLAACTTSYEMPFRAPAGTVKVSNARQIPVSSYATGLQVLDQGQTSLHVRAQVGTLAAVTFQVGAAGTLLNYQWLWKDWRDSDRRW